MRVVRDGRSFEANSESMHASRLDEIDAEFR
jgi:hypothetical protein